MSRTLTEYNEIWMVTYESAGDGHRLIADYFTDKAEAESYARSGKFRDMRVVQGTLWHTQGLGREWYKIEGGRMSRVVVDRQRLILSAMKKLTKQELLALGVTKIGESQ